MKPQNRLVTHSRLSIDRLDNRWRRPGLRGLLVTMDRWCKPSLSIFRISLPWRPRGSPGPLQWRRTFHHAVNFSPRRQTSTGGIRPMSRRTTLLIPALALALAGWPMSAPAAAPATPEPLLGFSNDHASEQRALESRFDSLLNAANLREWMRRLSARPHHVGSPYGKENAEFMAGLFRSWGYQTQIEQFKVLFPTPKTRVLEMEAPSRYKASLAEPGIAQDATSGQAAEQLPIYNAYSTDGDVTGDLVYVNFGVPKDYEELERRGIDVKGKIVIARYYGSW